MNKLNKKQRVLVLSIAVVIVLTIACGISVYLLKKTPNWNKSGALNTNNLYEVKTGKIELSQEGAANLVASKETNLYFNQVSGVLQNIDIKVNDVVAQGQELGKISSGDLSSQLEQAAIDDKIADVNSQKIDLSITNMNKTLELSKIDLDSSVKNFNDTKSTLEAITYAQTDADKAALKKAQSDFDNAQKENQKAALVYEQNQNQLESLKLDKETLNYTAQSRLLKSQQLQKNLDNCKLVAQTAGKITYVDNVSVLDYIAAGRVIAKIVEEKNYVLQFTSSNVGEFTPGMKVKIKVNGTTYNGTVYEPASGDLIKAEDSSVISKTQVYFTLEEPIKDLSLGSRATISVTTDEKDGVIVVPKAAIKENGSKITVNRYKDGEIETIEITKGIETGSNVEVISGLNVGDKIVSGY